MCFLACLLEEEWAARIRLLQEEMCALFGICRSLKSPPHITLVPPFWIGEDQVPELCQTAAIYSYSDLRMVAHHIDRFDDRVIYLRVAENEELLYLRNDLLRELIAKSYKVRRTVVYTPHVTLGHKISKSVFSEAWSHFKNVRITGEVLCHGPIVLVHHNGKWQPVDRTRKKREDSM